MEGLADLACYSFCYNQVLFKKIVLQWFSTSGEFYGFRGELVVICRVVCRIYNYIVDYLYCSTILLEGSVAKQCHSFIGAIDFLYILYFGLKILSTVLLLLNLSSSIHNKIIQVNVQ